MEPAAADLTGTGQHAGHDERRAGAPCSVHRRDSAHAARQNPGTAGQAIRSIVHGKAAAKIQAGVLHKATHWDAVIARSPAEALARWNLWLGENLNVNTRYFGVFCRRLSR